MSSDPHRRAAQLDVELEARLLQQLGAEWRGINYGLFKSALRPPVIRLYDGERPLARYDPSLRSLELARALVLEHPWTEVVEALKRLAVEQFVAERLRVDEHPRGPAYRRICWRLGVDPVPLDASAQARPAEAVAPGRAKQLARIRKLLALAGSPNRHEAETAALTAQRLLLALNLDVATVHAGTAPDEGREAYAYRHLGPARSRLAEHDQRLAKILADHFFVSTAWVPVYLPRRGARATVLEICGLDFNLAMAEHVHGFLRGTASRLWAADRAAREVRGAQGSEREAYLAGVMLGFETKLVDQQQRFAEQGLVWVPAPDLADYFRRRNPRLRGAAAGPGHAGEAFERGCAAGRSIVLAPPLGTASAAGGPPRALGPPR